MAHLTIRVCFHHLHCVECLLCGRNFLIVIVPLHYYCQGTNLRRYFEKVAAHHGLKFEVSEVCCHVYPNSFL